MLLSIVSCLYPLFFIFSTCLSLNIWNVALFEFVRRHLISSLLMIPRPVPGGWADEACTYCWVLVGLIWVLISRMPSLANLSHLYKHKSRNVISSIENSVVKFMHWCKLLMLSMNCSKLSFVSVHIRNYYRLCIFSNVWGRGLFLKGFWIPMCPWKCWHRIPMCPWKCWHRQVPSLYPWLCPVFGCKTYR